MVDVDEDNYFDM
jgi:hypothetical protein